MKRIVFIVLLLISFFSDAQEDAIYYYGANGKIADATSWRIKKNIDFKSARRVKIKTIAKGEGKNIPLFVENIRIEDDSIYYIGISGKIFKGGIVRTCKKMNDGRYLFADVENKKLKRKGVATSIIPLVLDGQVKEYYKSGEIKSISIYKDNELISNENWQADGSPYINNIFYSVDEEPLFLRGMGVMHNHLLKIFKQAGLDVSTVAGSIEVGFVVMENGRLNGIKIEKGINGTVNSIVVNAFKTLLGEWEPANLDGEVVRYYQIFPINFISNTSYIDYLEVRGNRMYWQN